MAQGPHVGSNHLATRLEREKGKEERRGGGRARAAGVEAGRRRAERGWGARSPAAAEPPAGEGRAAGGGRTRAYPARVGECGGWGAPEERRARAAGLANSPAGAGREGPVWLAGRDRGGGGAREGEDGERERGGSEGGRERGEK